MAEGSSPTGDMASALHAAMGSASGSGSTPSSTPSPSPSAPASAAASPPASTPASSGTAPTAPSGELDIHKEFPSGQIPLTRHQEILATTRQKQLETARADLLKELGPWNDLRSKFTPEEFGSIVQDLQEFSRSPERFLRKMASELGYQLLTPGQAWPGHGQTPSLPGQRNVPAIAEAPAPDLQFQGSDGNLYPFHSTERLKERDAWLIKRVEQEMQERLRPFVEQQQAQARTEYLGKIDSQARADVEEARASWEGFKDLEPHMKALMTADKRVTLWSAYQKAYREHYLPSRDQKIIERHDQELARRAQAAGTPVSPSTRPAAAPAQTTDSKKSIREQFKEKLSEFFPRTA